jgi:CheY-like chemotaxis protein
LPLLVEASAQSASSQPETSVFSSPGEDVAAENQLTRLGIVVVDDNADARLLLEFILKRAGAGTTACESGKHAIEIIRRTHPDVVLSDIMMPDLSGYEFLNEVRALGAEHGGQVPVIALTAFASANDVARMREAGFQLHISKPVEPAELIRAIAALVRRQT